MKKNVLLSVLLVGLFGVIGCANNPEESKDSNSNSNSNSYFYYEVVNNTGSDLNVKSCMASSENIMKNFYDLEYIKETDYVKISAGKSYVFKFDLVGNEDSFVGIDCGPWGDGYYYGGWGRQCLKNVKTTLTLNDINDPDSWSSKGTVEKYIDISQFICDKDSNFTHTIKNTTDKDVYGYAFFNQPEDDKWTYDFDYSTEWIKIPAGESIELKFNKDKHTGWYGGVLFGINSWEGKEIVKVENMQESLTTTITGFYENGIPIVE